MAFSILVSMLVSFTLTPMLSSRFLKLADARRRPQDQGAAASSTGSTRWYDAARRTGRSTTPASIIAHLGRRRSSLTFPLNRMVGRDFVPNEDMGEWTVHVDAPEGTSLEGTQRDRVRSCVKELQRHRGRRAASSRRSASAAAGRRHAHPLSSARRCRSRSGRSPQDADDHRDAAAAGGASRPTSRPSPRATRSAAARAPAASPISANLLGPDLTELAELLAAARWPQAQKMPSLADAKTELQRLESRRSTSPSIAQRAADLGVRMSTVGNTLRLAVAGDDEISIYRRAPEQYPVKIRVLENQRRDVEEIGRLTVPSAERARCASTTSPRIERGLGPSALQRSNRQFTVDAAPPTSRRATRSTRRPPTCARMLAGLEHAAGLCRSGCRGRRRSSTRPPPT